MTLRHRQWSAENAGIQESMFHGNVGAGEASGNVSPAKLTSNEESRLPDWASIVREHGPMAYQTAWRILGHIQDTEDVVQNALLEALRTYRKQRVKNWGGLLRRAATRRALDRLRKRREFSVISANTPSLRDERPDLIAAAGELAEWLREILTQLSERQAEVFCLRYFSEMTNTEIAATLAISVDAVGVALYKARTRIAEEWNKQDNAIRGKHQ